jgi:hypothetical protein
MSEDLSREEVDAAVDRLIAELLEKARLERPPVDALALAERHLGLTVSYEPEPPARGRARQTAGHAQLHLSPDATEEQRQWAAAHAVGVHLKPALLRRLGVEPRGGGSLANRLADRLLVPACWLAADAPAADYDLGRLKGLYRTATYEALALRLLDLPEPCIITVVDNDRVRRRRSNAWRVRRELSPAERECQRSVSSSGRPKKLCLGGWTVWGWPVPQDDGKREILRSVVDGNEAAEAGPPQAREEDDFD